MIFSVVREQDRCCHLTSGQVRFEGFASGHVRCFFDFCRGCVVRLDNKGCVGAVDILLNI